MKKNIFYFRFSMHRLIIYNGARNQREWTVPILIFTALINNTRAQSRSIFKGLWVIGKNSKYKRNGIFTCEACFNLFIELV